MITQGKPARGEAGADDFGFGVLYLAILRKNVSYFAKESVEASK
jgi:hypothetical protein